MRSTLSAFPLVIAFVAAGAAAQTYPATIPSPIAIPDGVSATACGPGAAAIATVNVPAGYGPATGITVTINLTHTWIGDIEVTLATPTGARINLMVPFCLGNIDDNSNLGAAYVFNDNGTQTVMTAAAVAACGDTCVVAAGTYRPDVPILPFLQCGVGGTWTLNVRDHVQFDAGTLNSFSITLTPGAPQNGARESFVICQTGPGQPVLLAHANGIAGGLYFTPMLFNTPASIPNGWFYGLDIPLPTLIAEATYPIPGIFLGSLGTGSVVFPVPGVPPGIQVSIVAVHTNVAGNVVFASYPVTYTTI